MISHESSLRILLMLIAGDEVRAIIISRLLLHMHGIHVYSQFHLDFY